MVEFPNGKCMTIGPGPGPGGVFIGEGQVAMWSDEAQFIRVVPNQYCDEGPMWMNPRELAVVMDIHFGIGFPARTIRWPQIGVPSVPPPPV